MKKDAIIEKRRKQKLKQLHHNMIIGIGALVCCCSVGLMFAYVVQDRIDKYPQYGDGWIPKTELQRQREAQKQIYVGR